MRRVWPAEAEDFARAVRSLLASLGEVDLARSAEEKPELRSEEVGPALRATGMLDLDLLGDEAESAAAVLAVRACGEVVAPFPVGRVAAVPLRHRAEAEALFVVDQDADHLEHADLFARAVAVDPADGRIRRVESRGVREHAPLDPFGAAVDILPGGDLGSLSGAELSMAFVLDGFWVAGALSRAVSDAARYATVRRQFGRTIGEFGEIRWRLADMAVALDGLEEVAAYTWFVSRAGRATVADALALRLAMLESADTVLSNAHQVHGAIGLCEEHDLAVIDRHLTSTLVRPHGQGRTATRLIDAVECEGFAATFTVPSAVER